MRRSTWFAVLGACAVLVLAGSLPRLPWDAVTAAWREGATRAVARWPVRTRRATTPPAASAAERPAAGGPALAGASAKPAGPRVEPSRRAIPALPRLVPPQLPVVRGPIPYAVAGALGGLAVLALGASLARGDRRGRVFRMAREGWPTARIARDARLAQDAIRVLLTPGVGTPRR